MTGDDYILTASGLKFYPLRPRSGDLYIKDIAHALAMKCRWGGHTRAFYSVAEHCIRCAEIVSPEVRLWALLHDAAEAYLPDICRPIKQQYPQLVEAEDRILALVCTRWGLPADMPTQVKWADDTLMVTEARDLMGFDARGDGRGTGLPEAQPVRIEPWGPAEAKHSFLKVFQSLVAEIV